MFQLFELIPNLSALENVVLPMEFAGVPGGKRDVRTRELLEAVGMVHREEREPPGTGASDPRLTDHKPCWPTAAMSASSAPFGFRRGGGESDAFIAASFTQFGPASQLA